jgi:hypothetical protein
MGAAQVEINRANFTPGGGHAVWCKKHIRHSKLFALDFVNHEAITSGVDPRMKSCRQGVSDAINFARFSCYRGFAIRYEFRDRG